MSRRKSVWISRLQLRAAAMELMRLQGFVPASQTTDVLRSDNLRAQRAVHDARRILLAAARATGAKARAWVRPPSICNTTEE